MIKKIKQLKSCINDAVTAAQAAGQLGDVEVTLLSLSLESEAGNRWSAMVKAATQDDCNVLKDIAKEAAIESGMVDNCKFFFTAPNEILGHNDGKYHALMTMHMKFSKSLFDVSSTIKQQMYDWNELIDDTIRHFIHNHSEADFINNFGMPERLAAHNYAKWETEGSLDERKRAADLLFYTIDDDKLTNYVKYLAFNRKWYGYRAMEAAKRLLKNAGEPWPGDEAINS